MDTVGSLRQGSELTDVVGRGAAKTGSVLLLITLSGTASGVNVTGNNNKYKLNKII
jgi:hypothetical protein